MKYNTIFFLINLILEVEYDTKKCMFSPTLDNNEELHINAIYRIMLHGVITKVHLIVCIIEIQTAMIMPF